MQPQSIAVAGAGPAGLATALLLARDGHAVTVFDRFEAPRPLGSGLILQPTGLAVLAELKLGSRLRTLGRRIDRLFGRVAPAGRLVLDVRYSALAGDRFGLAVHRSTLFDALFEAVKGEAVAIETGKRVIGLDRAAGGRPALSFEAGRTSATFDLVVDAMGMHSPLWPQFGGGARKHLRFGALWGTVPWAAGFDGHALEQRYRGAGTMIGVLPIGRRSMAARDEAAFFWSLKVEDYELWRRAGLSAWKERVGTLWPETWPLLEHIVDPGEMTLARYAHHMLRRPFADRVVAIGDAAHTASPQLGQGANMALLDASALASALRLHSDLGAALGAYAGARRWQMRFYQQISAAFTPFYQSESQVLPMLRDWLLAPATRLPLVRTFVAATVAGLVLDDGRTGTSVAGPD